MKELDDAAKTCIYIPPTSSGPSSTQSSQWIEYDLQMTAYTAVWTRCLARVRMVMKALYTPVINEVVQRVLHAYSDVLHGLPYPELPVVALTGTNSIVLAEIIQALEDSHQESGEDTPILQVHLYPAESSSVLNVMKAIVTGFVDCAPGRRRKPTSLASFDMNLLLAWFLAQEQEPKLTVFTHDFEQFDAKVMQDVFYICSMHVPQLPLVFVLVMNSPPFPSFLHTAYARSTLALLRVHQVTSPTEHGMVKHVLTKTFFDPDFEPDLMIGAAALDYVTDCATRHTASPDALITMLQLIHMKHFAQPLSVFVQNELLGTATPHDAERTLTSPNLHDLVDAIHSRLLAASPSQEPEYVTEAPQTPHELLAAISSARSTFHRHARRNRTALSIARIVERVALGDALQATVNGKSAEGRGSRFNGLETLSAVLRGGAGPQVRYVCMAVRKLPAQKLHKILHELHSFWYNLKNGSVRRDEEDARVWIVQMLNGLPEGPEEAQDDDMSPAQDARTKELANQVGDWLQQYIEDRFVRLEDCTMWDIWYTGAAAFPSELINPAPRPTVVGALLHPHEFIRAHAELVRARAQEEEAEDAERPDADEREREIWELPDTSIAFRRYVDAGRMVNVFDWFESFAVVLEDQRRHLRRAVRKGPLRTPRKGQGKSGKGKGRAVRQEEDQGVNTDGTDDDGELPSDEDDKMDEEEDEKWKVEVQARFIRALHELDYMGFVKHTGRKADHVIRTIYDVPD